MTVPTHTECNKAASIIVWGLSTGHIVAFLSVELLFFVYTIYCSPCRRNDGAADPVGRGYRQSRHRPGIGLHDAQDDRRRLPAALRRHGYDNDDTTTVPPPFRENMGRSFPVFTR